jgi:hypothetical protein
VKSPFDREIQVDGSPTWMVVSLSDGDVAAFLLDAEDRDSLSVDCRPNHLGIQ